MGKRFSWMFLVFVLSSSVYAEKKSRFFIDFGAYVTQFDQRFSAPAEASGEVSTLAGFARVRPSLHVGKNFFFEPSLGTMLPWRSNVDGSTKTFFTHFDLSLAKQIGFLKLRLGPGLLWEMMLSSAETVELSNGTGTTPFYTPGRTEHIFLATVQGGLSFNLSKRLCLSADVYALQILSGTRRRFNGSLTLGMSL